MSRITSSIEEQLNEHVARQMSSENINFGDVSTVPFWQDLWLLMSVSLSPEWGMMERHAHYSEFAAIASKLLEVFRRKLRDVHLSAWIEQVVKANAFNEARSSLSSIAEIRVIVATIHCPKPTAIQDSEWRKALEERVKHDHKLRPTHRVIFLIFLDYVATEDRSLDAIRIETVNYLLKQHHEHASKQ